MIKTLGAVVLWSIALGGYASDNVPVRPTLTAAAKKSSRTPPRSVVTVAPEPEAELSADHLALAQRVVVGKVPCELGAHVAITAHATAPGRFVLEHGKQKFHMAPVLTSTGAIRLEDPSGGAVWLQLANKSMLMDQKQGRRLADACMNSEQVSVAQAMERSPPPSLLDPVDNRSKVGSGSVQSATN